VATSARNEFFILSLASPAYSSSKARFLAGSEIARKGLLRLLSRNPSS
jgi:hypothetical protein